MTVLPPPTIGLRGDHLPEGVKEDGRGGLTRDIHLQEGPVKEELRGGLTRDHHLREVAVKEEEEGGLTINHLREDYHRGREKRNSHLQDGAGKDDRHPLDERGQAVQRDLQRDYRAIQV